MENALLHFLLAANSIEDGAQAIAMIKQGTNESVGSYALRFRTVLSKFLSAVERTQGQRSPFNCLTTELWQIGLLPSIRSLHFQTDPPKSLQAAIELARRIETTGVTGATVSALSGSSPFAPPSQAARGKSTRIVVGNDSAAPARSSGGSNRNRGSGGGRDDARASGNHNSNARASGRGNRGSNRSRGRAFDICTFSGCRSRESHPLEDCWAKKRADEEAAKKKTTKPSPKRSRSASHKRSGSDSE